MIPTATSTASGLMSPAIFTQHGINTTKVSNVTHTGDVTDAAGVLTVDGINGVELAPLGTGILRLANGVPSIATEAAQFPTLNQSTTGNANTATTATNLAGGGVGQVPYQTGSGATAMLAAGTAGYVLKSNGSAAPSWSQVNISSETTGTLPVTSGGTGAATFTAGILKANNTSAFITTPAPNGDIVGTNDIQTLTNKTLGTGTTFSNPISVGNGGTGASTFTAGILTANGANAFSTTPAPAGDLVGTSEPQILTNKLFGSGTTFSTAISVVNGGTGASTFTAGFLKADGTSSFTTVAGPTGDIVGTTDTQTLTNKTLTSPTISGGTISSLSSPIAVASGGTGAATLTGYVKGTGTTAMTAAATVPVADISGTLPVSKGGTGVTAASTGSGGVVLSTSPTLVTPVLGTPTSGTLTSCTGLPLTTGVTGTLLVANGGTGVTTSTGSGANVLATSPTLVTPVLGTPAAGSILTNCTGLPLTAGVTGTLPVANGGTGVTQSAYAESYISTSAATTYSATNTWYKISGSTSLTTGENFDDASGTDNRIRYTGTASRAFFITVCGTVTGTNSNTILVGLDVSGTHKDASITAVTISGTHKHPFSSQAIVFLDTNDYIEVHTQNQSSTNNATFERLSICVHALV